MQLETKYQNMSMTFRISTDFPEIQEKKVPHTTKFFGILIFEILPDNRHTNIHKTARLKIIKIIFY
jgi:hypothetical protein